jgi:hypothetical protein
MPRVKAYVFKGILKGGQDVFDGSLDEDGIDHAPAFPIWIRFHGFFQRFNHQSTSEL